MWRGIGNKFGAKRVKVGDRSYASGLEASLHAVLLQREKAGEISDVRCQHSFEYPCSIRWRVDYSFLKDGRRVYCEAKGAETDTYVLKKKMFLRCPMIPDEERNLEVWKGRAENPKLVEETGALSAGEVFWILLGSIALAIGFYVIGELTGNGF